MATVGKKRHGCLTAWLILMIVANSLTAIGYVAGAASLRQALPNAPAWAFPLLAVLALFNLVCAIALFMWKKWAFWGFCASAILGAVINISLGLGIGSAVGAIIGLGLLYAVLQIGQDNKGWPQLE